MTTSEAPVEPLATEIAAERLAMAMARNDLVLPALRVGLEDAANKAFALNEEGVASIYRAWADMADAVLADLEGGRR